MLISMCVTGVNAGEFADESSYSINVGIFVGSGGNVLIARLQGLTLSDTDDLTITLFSVGENNKQKFCCSFAADEIIVEQPDEYHNDTELYLKNEKIPADDDIGSYLLRIISDSLTYSDGNAVNTVDKAFSPFDAPSYYIGSQVGTEDNSNPVVGNYINIDSYMFETHENRITVTTETPGTLSVKDKTRIDIIGAGDARFTVKYNDFVYETLTLKTYSTNTAYIIASHTVHGFIEYFENIGYSLYFISYIPSVALAATIVAWPLMPVTFPIAFVGVFVFYFINIFCSLFGVKLIPDLSQRLK